ncbi:hypothetical protein MRX96_058312 [Rhipicephalus microplus]
MITERSIATDERRLSLLERGDRSARVSARGARETKQKDVVVHEKKRQRPDCRHHRLLLAQRARASLDSGENETGIPNMLPFPEPAIHHAASSTATRQPAAQPPAVASV